MKITDQCRMVRGGSMLRGLVPMIYRPLLSWKSEAKVYKQLYGIVEEWVEIHQQEGEKQWLYVIYSG